MCGVLPALAALGGAIQYKQQQDAAEAQASAYRAQAQAAEQNAKIESRKQEQIADNYAQEASKLKARQRLAEGSQRAAVGSAGLDFSGSQLDILSSGLSAYENDQLNLLSNQRNDNFASRVQQTNYINQARANRSAADNVESQAKLAGIGTILGTAASVVGLSNYGKTDVSEASGTTTDFGTITANAGHGYTAAYNSAAGATSIKRTTYGSLFNTNTDWLGKNKYSFNWK